MDLLQSLIGRKSLVRRLVNLVCLLLLATATLQAQQTSGSAVGTVTDNTGAVVSGATVTLTDVDTGDHRTATTNSNGDYQFVNLIPGNYKVDIENSGFKHFIRTNVVVQVQGSTRVDALCWLADERRMRNVREWRRDDRRRNGRRRSGVSWLSPGEDVGGVKFEKA